MKKQIKNLETKAVKNVKTVKGGANRNTTPYSDSFTFVITDGGQP